MAEIVSTVGAVGRDFANLGLWQAARQMAGADLVARGDTEIADCYDDGAPVSAGAGGFTLAGWVTNAANRVIVRAAPDHRHGGVITGGNVTGNGAWIDASAASAGSAGLTIRQNFTLVEGLRVFVTPDRASVRFENGAASSFDGSVLRKVFVHGLHTAQGGGGFSLGTFVGPEATATLEECQAHHTATGVVINAFGVPFHAKVHHCLVHDCTGASFDMAESNGAGTSMELINTASIKPAAAAGHARITLGNAVYTGRANAQDDSTAVNPLPDDGPEPSFTDLEVVADPALPASPPGIVLLDPNFDNTHDFRSKGIPENALFGNGAVLASFNGTSDLDGVARSPAIRHIGPYVVQAPPVLIVRFKPADARVYQLGATSRSYVQDAIARDYSLSGEDLS